MDQIIVSLEYLCLDWIKIICTCGPLGACLIFSQPNQVRNGRVDLQCVLWTLHCTFDKLRFEKLCFLLPEFPSFKYHRLVRDFWCPLWYWSLVGDLNMYKQEVFFRPWCSFWKRFGPHRSLSFFKVKRHSWSTFGSAKPNVCFPIVF